MQKKYSPEAYNEARNVIAKIDAGGVPGFIGSELRRTAANIGVEIKSI